MEEVPVPSDPAPSQAPKPPPTEDPVPDAPKPPPPKPPPPVARAPKPPPPLAPSALRPAPVEADAGVEAAAAAVPERARSSNKLEASAAVLGSEAERAKSSKVEASAAVVPGSEADLDAERPKSSNKLGRNGPRAPPALPSQGPPVSQVPAQVAQDAGPGPTSLSRVPPPPPPPLRTKALEEGPREVHLHSIRFTQDSVKSQFRDGRSTSQTIKDLRSGALQASDLPMIRVVRAFESGFLFSLDNRRLRCLQKAFPEKQHPNMTVKVLMVSEQDPKVKEELQSKFTACRSVVQRGAEASSSGSDADEEDGAW